MRRDLKIRSSELICWLTADWVTPLICAALVKLSVSARSQKTFRLSICIWKIEYANKAAQSTDVGSRMGDHLFHLHEQFLAGERLLQIHRIIRPASGRHVAAGGQ